jgi:undecaprenyl diphosphate synthase
MSAETAGNDGKWLNLAINYGGRDELVRAVRRLAGSDLAAIDEKMLADSLDHPELGDIDLLIRTSGELRISNFCLWQLAYAELYFTETYWPAFSDAELAEAIRAYQSRERRFGGREE